MSMNSERNPLDDALAALRSEYTEEPPSRIESFLTVRLRVERRRKAIRLWRTAAAASAAAMLLIWLGTRPRQERHQVPPVTSARQTQLASPVPESVTQPVSAERIPVAPRPERVARQKRERSAHPEHKNAALPALFIAVPYTEPLAPSEQLDIYRVQLPRVTMSLYGLAARTGDLEAPVTADVAVGSDGVVRAVRFVR